MINEEKMRRDMITAGIMDAAKECLKLHFMSKISGRSEDTIVTSAIELIRD